jgi:hypothetical protein
VIGAMLAGAVHTYLFAGAAPVEPEMSAVAAEPSDAAARSAARRAGRGRDAPS